MGCAGVERLSAAGVSTRGKRTGSTGVAPGSGAGARAGAPAGAPAGAGVLPGSALLVSAFVSDFVSGLASALLASPAAFFPSPTPAGAGVETGVEAVAWAAGLTGSVVLAPAATLVGAAGRGSAACGSAVFVSRLVPAAAIRVLPTSITGSLPVDATREGAAGPGALGRAGAAGVAPAWGAAGPETEAAAGGVLPVGAVLPAVAVPPEAMAAPAGAVVAEAAVAGPEAAGAAVLSLRGSLAGVALPEATLPGAFTGVSRSRSPSPAPSSSFSRADKAAAAGSFSFLSFDILPPLEPGVTRKKPEPGRGRAGRTSPQTPHPSLLSRV